MSNLRDLTPDELTEFQGLHRTIAAEKFKAYVVSRNTALVPGGKALLKELNAVIQLMENAKTDWVSSKLAECGVKDREVVSLDAETGKITRS